MSVLGANSVVGSSLFSNNLQNTAESRDNVTHSSQCSGSLWVLHHNQLSVQCSDNGSAWMRFELRCSRTANVENTYCSWLSNDYGVLKVLAYLGSVAYRLSFPVHRRSYRMCFLSRYLKILQSGGRIVRLLHAVWFALALYCLYAWSCSNKLCKRIQPGRLIYRIQLVTMKFEPAPMSYRSCKWMASQM